MFKFDSRMRRKSMRLLSSRVPVLVGYLLLSLFVFMASKESVFLRRPDPVNKHVVRQMCGTKLAFGEMCPKLYTELGGRCELRGSKFDCPDIRHMANTTMRQAQLAMVRMLRIFHLITVKHNIRYWLSFGTLIGAARHKGFIPWDHDVDIEMPLQDYVKFFTTGSKDLPRDIFFQNSKTDSYFQVGVDLDSNDDPTHPAVGTYVTPMNGRLRDIGSCYGYCLLYGCKWHDGLMIDLFVTGREMKDVLPSKDMEFEGFVFPVPKNWSGILRQDYGDDVLKIPSQRHERKPVIIPYPTTDCQKLGEIGVAIFD